MQPHFQSHSKDACVVVAAAVQAIFLKMCTTKYISSGHSEALLVKSLTWPKPTLYKYLEGTRKHTRLRIPDLGHQREKRHGPLQFGPRWKPIPQAASSALLNSAAVSAKQQQQKGLPVCHKRKRFCFHTIFCVLWCVLWWLFPLNVMHFQRSGDIALIKKAT